MALEKRSRRTFHARNSAFAACLGRTWYKIQVAKVGTVLILHGRRSGRLNRVRQRGAVSDEDHGFSGLDWRYDYGNG